jgi:hypothetical protein
MLSFGPSYRRTQARNSTWTWAYVEYGVLALFSLDSYAQPRLGPVEVCKEAWRLTKGLGVRKCDAVVSHALQRTPFPPIGTPRAPRAPSAVTSVLDQRKALLMETLREVLFFFTEPSPVGDGKPYLAPKVLNVAEIFRVYKAQVCSLALFQRLVCGSPSSLFLFLLPCIATPSSCSAPRACRDVHSL